MGLQRNQIGKLEDGGGVADKKKNARGGHPKILNRAGTRDKKRYERKSKRTDLPGSVVNQVKEQKSRQKKPQGKKKK